jgi:hypothetical protein
MDIKKEELIKRFFYNPESGYIGINKLYYKLKDKGITKADIKKVLEKQEVVQVNKKNVGKHRSFVAPYPKYQYQIDLIYLENTHLNKASYGLTMIDIFSRKGDIELLKKRDTPNVLSAFNKLIERMGVPEFIYSDEGSEFISTEFKQLLKKLNINQILTLSHAPFAERFNRTIKEMLDKYLQSTNSKTITNILPKVIKNYNNSFHRSIGMTPNEVNKTNQDAIYLKLSLKANTEEHPKLNKGDRVRVRLKSTSFEKGYKPKWSKTTYIIQDKEKDGVYTIEGLTRKYLRSFIQKIGEVQAPIIAPDNLGTLEGTLQTRAKLRSEVSRVEKEKERSIRKSTRLQQPKEKPKPVIDPVVAKRNVKIDKLNVKYVGEKFIDDDIEFVINKVYWDGRRKDIIVDYQDTDKTQYFSLLSELKLK